MIYDETLKLLRRSYGKPLTDVRVESAVIGISFTGVKLSTGACAIAYTPEGAKALHHRDPSRKRRKPPPGRLRGVNVRRLLFGKTNEPLEKAIRVAVLGALSAPLLRPERYRMVADEDALDLLNPSGMRSVCLVGAFGTYIRRLQAVRSLKLRVLELREDAFNGDDRRFYVPAHKAPQVLPLADTVIITGSSIANGTIDGLLSCVRPGSRVAVVGPTSSILPDVLFKRGVTMVSGAAITDADQALETLSQGGSAYHLYGLCARKINLFPK